MPIARISLDGYLQEYSRGVIAVVLLTVLGQVLRAANSNPAEVVKSE